MREHLKFKQLLNQFKSLKFEEEYLKDYLMEANELLEEALDEYIEQQGISRRLGRRHTTTCWIRRR